MSTISKRLIELHRQDPAGLAATYVELFGKEPRVKNAAWLRRQVVWKIQERALGGLGERAKARLDELLAQIDLPITAPAPRQRPATKRDNPTAPMVGTTLVRAWHDQQIRVEVRADGYEWNGVTYKSLSACAKAITGAAWSGRLFFGLTTRRSAS